MTNMNGAKATLTPEGAIVAELSKGKITFKKIGVGNLGDRPAVTAAYFETMATKEIDGFTCDLLGVDKIGKSATKAKAVERFFRTADQKLEMSAAEIAGQISRDVMNGAHARKILKFQFDPSNEAQVKMFNDMAPQAKACVLAGLGTRVPPAKAQGVVKSEIPYPKLVEHLERFRASVFGGTHQPLERILGYHRPQLILGGFLQLSGDGGVKSTRATDKYIYCFKVPDGKAAKASIEKFPPQARDYLKAIVGAKVDVEGGEKEIQGDQLRQLLVKAWTAGKIKTRQNPFRIFQYHEHLYVDAGFLRVRA